MNVFFQVENNIQIICHRCKRVNSDVQIFIFEDFPQHRIDIILRYSTASFNFDYCEAIISVNSTFFLLKDRIFFHLSTCGGYRGLQARISPRRHTYEPIGTSKFSGPIFVNFLMEIKLYQLPNKRSLGKKMCIFKRKHNF